MRRPSVALVCLLALAPAAPASGEMLVMPFENVTHENRIVWLGEAAAVLLADEFNALGVSAISRDERQEAFEQLQVPRSAALTDATVVRIGELVGAATVALGTLQLDGPMLVVHARVIALATGRLQGAVTERGEIADLFAIFERVARQFAPPGASASGRDHPPVVAFESYIKGLLSETPTTAITYLSAALRADPTFDRARLALWDLYSEQGEHARALAAATAVSTGSPFAGRAAFLAGLSQISLQRYNEAFVIFKGLTDTGSSAAALNNLGVIQMRRGGTRETGLPTYYFNRAVEADGTESDYCFNLGYAYWAARDLPAAIYWLREAVRRNPSDGDAHYVLGAALAGEGKATEAHREKDLARRLSSTYAEWDKRPSSGAVPRGLERVRRGVELPRTGFLEESLVVGRRDERELAHFYLDRARRLYEQERDRDALADANRALFLLPYLSEAHILVGRIHLRGERTLEAVDALKIAVWSADSPEAHAALATAFARAGDLAGARTEATRALALDPASGEARRVLDTLSPP